ncbi:MAG: NAD-dependent deacylase [Verrucomicrobiota bacterium]
MKKCVVLSGSGISAPSGIATFRAGDGLWNGHRVEEVATPEAWARDPAKVLQFYNERRAQLDEVVPNSGHQALAQLEDHFEVCIVTQNVDDLHERAGSSHVIHLHGELKKARSSTHESLVYEIGTKPIELGDRCEQGSQLRPHIVWFGEVPFQYFESCQYTREADVFIVVGTSLQVYPAAGLVNEVSRECQCFHVDPDSKNAPLGFETIAESADQGLPKLVSQLIDTL